MAMITNTGRFSNNNEEHVLLDTSMGNLSQCCTDMLDSLKDRYCRLLLITGDQTPEKDTLIQSFGNSLPHLQFGKILVGIISNLSSAQRSKVVLDFFTNLQTQSEMLFLLVIEILFDRALNIDPLKLLKQTARNRPIIVNWPGKIDFHAKLLTYATPGHSEYFEADLTDDILFWDESGRNSLNSEVTGGCHEI